MKNKIQILSRSAAQALMTSGFPQHAAVISFCDPKTCRTPSDYAPLNYDKVCDRVFSVALHDIDIEILGDFGLTFETYFPESDALAGFIMQAVEDGCDILCQCEYGQSRSAACAAAIKEYFDGNGIEIFADYRYYPNQLVFNKLLASLRAKGKGKNNGNA